MANYFSGWDNSGANVIANSLAGLGEQFGKAIEKQGKLQSAQSLGQKIAANDLTGAMQDAFNAGDIETGMKLYKQADEAKYLSELSPQLYGGNTALSPIVSNNGQSSRPNVINAATPDVINSTANKYGINPSDFAKTSWIESSFNPNANSNSSSAGGLFQFTDKTAKQYGLNDKFSAGDNADAAARLWKDNEAILTKGLGRAPTGAEMYLAHQQGATGAMKLLSNPNAPAASVVGVDAVRLNGGDPNMSAGQFAGLWTDKFNRTQIGKGVEQGAPMPDQLKQTAQNNPSLSGNPGMANDSSASSSGGQSLPFGAKTWEEAVTRGTNLVTNRSFSRAPESFQTQVKTALAQAQHMLQNENARANLPSNKLPAEVSARREQGRAAGLSGAELENYALTGNVLKPGELQTAGQKKISEGFADDYNKIYKPGLAAGNKSVAMFNQMEGLMKDPNFYSGAGGEAVTKAKKFLSSMGVTAPDGASANEVFDAYNKQLTLAAMNGTLGPGVSNADVSFITSQNPSLGNTPEGNLELIRRGRAVAQRQVEVGKMANAYIKKHGELDAGFEDQVQQFAEANPIFGKVETQPQTLPQPQQQPQQQPQPTHIIQDANGNRMRLNSAGTGWERF